MQVHSPQPAYRSMAMHGIHGSLHCKCCHAPWQVLHPSTAGAAVQNGPPRPCAPAQAAGHVQHAQQLTAALPARRVYETLSECSRLVRRGGGCHPLGTRFSVLLLTVLPACTKAFVVVGAETGAARAPPKRPFASAHHLRLPGPLRHRRVPACAPAAVPLAAAGSCSRGGRRQHPFCQAVIHPHRPVLLPVPARLLLLATPPRAMAPWHACIHPAGALPAG